jgi:hypothetical protein
LYSFTINGIEKLHRIWFIVTNDDPSPYNIRNVTAVFVDRWRCVASAAYWCEKHQPICIVIIKHCRTLLTVTSGGRSSVWRLGRRRRRDYLHLFLPLVFPELILVSASVRRLCPDHLSFILTHSTPPSCYLLLKTLARHFPPRIIGHKSNAKAPSFLLYPYSVSWPNIILTFGLFDIK